MFTPWVHPCFCERNAGRRPPASDLTLYVSTLSAPCAPSSIAASSDGAGTNLHKQAPLLSLTLSAAAKAGTDWTVRTTGGPPHPK